MRPSDPAEVQMESSKSSGCCVSFRAQKRKWSRILYPWLLGPNAIIYGPLGHSVRALKAGILES